MDAARASVTKKRQGRASAGLTYVPCDPAAWHDDERYQLKKEEEEEEEQNKGQRKRWAGELAALMELAAEHAYSSTRGREAVLRLRGGVGFVEDYIGPRHARASSS